MHGSQASSTRWCGPAWSAPASTSARLTRFASSTRASASICGQRTRGAMAEPAALSELDSRIAGLAVNLRGVTKVYDSGVMALGPLDLDVAKGEFVSLLGPSGCGKSTALRLIAGLNAPTSGTVHVSRPVVGVRGRHSVGFVFQEPTLMPWTSVRENVRLPLKLAHAPAREADVRIDEALAQMGLA